jgi:Fe-S oxidoreductase
VAKATVEAFTKLGVKPTLLGKEERCCGVVFLFTGQLEAAKENAEKVAEVLNAKDCELLVTGCAGCYRTFTKSFKELDVKTNFKVMHTSQLVESLIESQELRFKDLPMKVTYHDPCELGRRAGVYDSPRNVLKAIPSLNLVEMENSRDQATCCGAGGGMFGIYTRLAQLTARNKIAKEVLPLKVEALVTACPTCYMNFSYIIRKEKMPLKICDLMEIVNMAL